MNTATEEEVEDEGTAAPETVVVGVRLDEESRELLTWALINVAASGSRVVAIHILPAATGGRREDAMSLLSILNELDSMVAVYEGFCNLKQIDLKWTICQSHSIHKALVHEAKYFAATKLVLGASEEPIRFSIFSAVKYCARKVPRDCQVLVVRSGKIVYERASLERCRSKGSRNTNKSSAIDNTKPRSCRPKAKLESKWSLDSSTSEEILASSPNCDAAAASSATVSELARSEPSCSTQLDGRYYSQNPPSIERQSLYDAKNKKSVVRWVKQLSNKYAASFPNHPDRKRSLKFYANGILDFDKKREMVGAETCPFPGIHDAEGELRELENIRDKYGPVCRLFSYKELKQATCNFSTERLIGKGGNSRVYRGSLPADAKELAVKVLKPSWNALKGFSSELEIITTSHHKNIITLLGFCAELDNLILVYDLFPRGNLDQVLHGTRQEEKKNILNWVDRYNVAIGIAEALCYLHGSGNAQPVIHRDVKSSNILLAVDSEPQLCDFGLAKRASSSQSHITCRDVEGTFGYLAPEYFMYGKVNDKVDVYAFGVVLLELISGRKPISTGCKGQESLVVWAKTVLKCGKAKDLVDPCLSDEYDDDELERMALAASLCIRRASRTRPRMGLVLKLLQGDENAVEWARSLAASLEDPEVLDDETARQDNNIRTHISLALHDVVDDSQSVSSSSISIEQMSDCSLPDNMEDYLQHRWSRSSSFN